MLSDYRHSGEKGSWAKTDHVIDNWLEERHELLSAYYTLSDIPPFAEKNISKSLQLKEFCELLIDYVSAGQFEVFEKIYQAQKETQPNSLHFNVLLVQKMLKSTIKALDFNDLCHNTQRSNKEVGQIELRQAISELGEALADRFEYENKLIEIYLAVTQSKPKLRV